MECELLITDVTQMRNGKVCIAGVTHERKAVRLLLRYGEILAHHLKLPDGNVLRPRVVIGVEVEPHEKLRAPHVEDHFWLKSVQTRFLRVVDDTIWRQALQRTCSPTLNEVFGVELVKKRRLAPDCGQRSLGTIKPVRIIRLHVAPSPYAEKEEFVCRIDFADSDDEGCFNIPVTDLTLLRYIDHLIFNFRNTPEEAAHRLSQKLRKLESFLRVGLTRPYQQPGKHETWSYLQVNGVHTFPDYFGEFHLAHLLNIVQNEPQIERDELPF